MSNPYASQQRSQLANAAPQSAEGWALVETARRLESAKQNPQDLEAILAAVRTNWRIWTIIQSSLVDPDCPLPREIRENLLNLSRFIDRRSAELIASPKDVHKLDVLINIDRQIGAGLLGNPSEDEAAGQPAAAPATEGTSAPQSAATLVSAQENTAEKPTEPTPPSSGVERSATTTTTTEA